MLREIAPRNTQHVFLSPMLIIKRYPNRKLYNTETKSYITLDGIAALIRDGVEVQVVDHSNDDDITTVILSQIIFEQEKKQGQFLPKSVLTGLIQAGGDTLTSLRQTLTMPLQLLQHIDEEINRRIQALIKRGELEEQFGQRLRDKLLALNPRESSPPTSAKIAEVLEKQDVATQADIQQLTTQIEQLAAKLAQLEQQL